MRLRQVLSLFAIVDCPAQPSSQRRLYVESFGPISFASSNCFPLISGVVSELADCSWPRLFLQHAYPRRFFKCCEQFLFLLPTTAWSAWTANSSGVLPRNLLCLSKVLHEHGTFKGMPSRVRSPADYDFKNVTGSDPASIPFSATQPVATKFAYRLDSNGPRS